MTKSINQEMTTLNLECRPNLGQNRCSLGCSISASKVRKIVNVMARIRKHMKTEKEKKE